jgi:phage terminase small subunit
MSPNKPLTAKQEAFCRHYVANGFNATQAAISAGYSEDTAQEQGSQNLSKLIIQERIAELSKGTVERAKATADQVFEFATNAAFFDLGEFLDVDSDGVYLKQGVTFADLPKSFRILIQGVKERKSKFGTTVEIIFVDKMKAVDMLARFHSMYKDQVTMRVEGELSPEELEELEELRLKQNGKPTDKPAQA